MPKENNNIPRLQLVIAVVVSAAWLALIVLPAIAPAMRMDEVVRTSVLAAMALIIGALFGPSVFKRNGDNNNGNDEEEK